MTNQEKLAKLEELMELDVGALKEDTNLSALDEWDSLSILSFVVMMEDDFGKIIKGPVVKQCKTVAELMAMMER